MWRFLLSLIIASGSTLLAFLGGSTAGMAELLGTFAGSFIIAAVVVYGGHAVYRLILRK